MKSETIETFQFGDKHYVLAKTAANYLHVPLETLHHQISLGTLEAKKVGSREFIELRSLKAFGERKGFNTSIWGKR